MDLARLALTFGALALGGRLGALVDAPLVGEIVVGMLLGPDGAGFVPESDAFILVGDFALCVLVMEGGDGIDVDVLVAQNRIKRVGNCTAADALCDAGGFLLIGIDQPADGAISFGGERMGMLFADAEADDGDAQWLCRCSDRCHVLLQALSVPVK